MGVAWSPTGVGEAETEVLVRDPVVVTASLPRFLAPDDRSRLLLDQDRAARGARLAQLYQTLGFGQQALTEAVKSLAASPSAGTAPLTVDVTVDRGLLPDGEHEGTLTIESDASEGNPTATVSVAVQVGGISQGNVGTVFVLLLDTETSETVAFTAVDFDDAVPISGDDTIQIDVEEAKRAGDDDDEFKLDLDL